MASNFSWVVDNKLAGCAFPHVDEDIKQLYSAGVRAIVSLTERVPSSYSIQNMGIDLIHIPIIDWGVPSTDTDVFKFIHFLEEKLPYKPVVVHCFAGIGRTGLMLALYFIWFENMSGKEAITHIRSLRYPSIETREQEDFLIDLANNLESWKKRYEKYIEEVKVKSRTLF